MRYLYIILIALFCTASVQAQKITGRVYDANTLEPLVGVSISYKYKGEYKGAFTEVGGSYTIDAPTDAFVLIFNYLGYKTENHPIVVSGNETLKQDIYLKVHVELLSEVVVSAGRFEQKLSDVTVSMNILKAEDVARQNPKDLRFALSTIPGVDITDNQPSIRSGNGWTYGVGSRCQILLDGLSVLTPNGGEIDWNVIPMENIAQVEVLKGSSSVLYGSSALNGIINIRTSRPGFKPKTNIGYYLGIYEEPKNGESVWWSKNFWKQGKYPVEPLGRNFAFAGISNPIYEGLDFSHTRRIGNFDITGAINLMTDEGYRKGDFTKRTRFGGNLTYHNPNYDLLNYGFNINFTSAEKGDFFLWRSEKEVYSRSSLANMGRENNILFVDPFVNYVNEKKGVTHKFKGRFFLSSDRITTIPDDRNIIDIIKNMGVNDASLESIQGIIADPMIILTPLIKPILQNDIAGAVDAIVGIGNELFPGATQADYVDLISWVMTNGLPINGDITSWAMNVLSPTKTKIKPDRTYSYFIDYQFGKKLGSATFTTGVTYEHVDVDSGVTGTHVSDNIAAYLQYDQKFFDRLNISVGTRFEYYRVDDKRREAETNIFGKKIPVKPIFRGGINYQLAEHSFLRASFGMGYRYPSITEKHIVKNIGGVGGYPNIDLKAETGYNSEIGIKQGYKFGPFMGYFDMALFYTRYKDMIEFEIGLVNPDPSLGYPFIRSLTDIIPMLASGNIPSIGAKFTNVSRAAIYGVDLSFNGYCDINPNLKLIYSIGYVYTEPLDLDYKKTNEAEAANTDLLAMKSKSNTGKHLKYRQRHDFKTTLDFQWERFSIGTNLSYKSKTLATDYFLIDERQKLEPDAMDFVRSLVFGNLHQYWSDTNKGYFLMDMRFTASVTKNVKLSLLINNLLNKEYSLRPMAVNPPRTFMFRLNITI